MAYIKSQVNGVMRRCMLFFIILICDFDGKSIEDGDLNFIKVSKKTILQDIDILMKNKIIGLHKEDDVYIVDYINTDYKLLCKANKFTAEEARINRLRRLCYIIYKLYYYSTVYEYIDINEFEDLYSDLDLRTRQRDMKLISDIGIKLIKTKVEDYEDETFDYEADGAFEDENFPTKDVNVIEIDNDKMKTLYE
ncbi:hypothetical protein D2A34_19855 [Clostridium chromiireducens]|uniref:Uncharacterized protein n=1 Tax=Clostridium chromiireducens TaxID=225345 RepID=A0A399IJ88_9CLOT|nr:hypothetical protein [Clostridium chromiireducens]RII33084.1 hypothetical protein D2A34_19855 [Clostridium chromiireducens]